MNNNTLASVRFVFGFRLRADGSVVTTVPSGNVFRGAGLIDHALNGPSRSDFAVVRLDRPAVGHPIVRVRRSLKIANQQAVYVIGHPSGLPLKHADGANVRDNDPGAFFSANLDTYGGNSGSPVFNSETNLVEGILVRGDTDFVTENGCRVSNVCPINGCGGEDVTRTSEFVKHVPDAPIDEHLDLDERVTRLEESVEEVLAIVKQLEDE
ncbi:MAG: serine protease [Planctomycetota bacterium]|nr:serine protease [Planctomycetota bacterium]